MRALALDDLRKSDAASDAWLLAAYEAAHKPGGERNPILADGDLPLTRDEADDVPPWWRGCWTSRLSAG